MIQHTTPKEETSWGSSLLSKHYNKSIIYLQFHLEAEWCLIAMTLEESRENSSPSVFVGRRELAACSTGLTQLSVWVGEMHFCCGTRFSSYFPLSYNLSMRNVDPFKLGTEKEKKFWWFCPFSERFAYFPVFFWRGRALSQCCASYCSGCLKLRSLQGRKCRQKECCFSTVVQTDTVRLTLWSEL